MRIYVGSYPDGFRACAAEIPGSGATGHELASTRDGAIERCRAFALAEIAAFERLGSPLGIDPEEQVVEWTGPIWLVPEFLVPLRPAQLRAAIARMDELASEVERTVAPLTLAQREARAGTEWSAAMVLDHLAQGYALGVIHLEPYPLDAVEAQAETLALLVADLRACIGGTFTVTHFGVNPENGRIRWTPRKIAQAVRAFQDAAARHAAEGGAQPRPWSGHDERPDDDQPITESEVAAIEERGRGLLAADPARTAPVAFWYRYYRTRLVRWPEDGLTRMRAMYTAFRERLLAADEADIARVRLPPTGMPLTIRSELRLGIGHVVGHLDQIRAATRAVSV